MVGELEEQTADIGCAEVVAGVSVALTCAFPDKTLLDNLQRQLP